MLDAPARISGRRATWYHLDGVATLARLRSSDTGLGDDAARLALERYGPNELPRGKADGAFVPSSCASSRHR